MTSRPTSPAPSAGTCPSRVGRGERFRGVVFPAVLCTAATFLLVPFLGFLSPGVGPEYTLREFDTAVMPEPPPPPSEAVEPRLRTAPRPAAPRLEEPRAAIPLTPRPVLDFNPADVPMAQGLSFALAEPVSGANPAALTFELSEVDRVPRPLYAPEPAYPHAARQAAVTGEVVVEFVVNAQGRVEGIRIVSAEPAGVFGPAALRPLDRWRFEPGAKEGETVAVRMRQRFLFRMD